MLKVLTVHANAYKKLKIIFIYKPLMGTRARYATRRCAAKPIKIKQFNPLSGNKSSLRYPEARSQAERVSNWSLDMGKRAHHSTFSVNGQAEQV